MDWLASSGTDVLALQETKVPDQAFPTEPFCRAGFVVHCSGQPSYNGVALISRWPLLDVLHDVPGLDDPERRVLAATVETDNGPIRLINLYVINGREVDTEPYRRKLAWLVAVRAWVADERRAHERLLVLGDFNIAPTDQDVYDPERWYERILCSTRERQALEGLLETGLFDSFRACYPDQVAYSWWDYRGAMFRRGMGLRIDLILASKALLETMSDAGIDTEPRRLTRPSDHAPVWIQFDH